MTAIKSPRKITILLESWMNYLALACIIAKDTFDKINTGTEKLSPSRVS
jgi:hypothetical protein